MERRRLTVTAILRAGDTLPLDQIGGLQLTTTFRDFVITYPLWMPVTDERPVNEQGQRVGELTKEKLRLLVSNAGTDRLMLLFTDQDLAERFSASLKRSDVFVDKFESKTAIIEMIKCAERQGLSRGAFDVTGVGFRIKNLFSLEELKSHLKQGLV
jgi:hypothetical protein